jgi:phosphoesterase RecJ-like protein
VSITDLERTDAMIGQLLKKAGSILLVSHIRPDGDAIGSLVGMGTALREAGKQTQMVMKDSIPPRYKFLQGSELIVHAPADSYEISIALDCGDIARLGDFFLERKPDINIDHHITNENFARFNLTIPDAVSTSAILAEYLPHWGFPLSPISASALTMGILTDTNGFRIPSVTPHVLRLAADLMEEGAQLPEIYHKALVSQSLQTSKLWGLALAKLQEDNGLLWTSISLKDRENVGYAGRDDAEITNFLTSVESSKIAVLFNEQSNDKVKISWRSRNHLDVAKLAQHYGGGGHPNAAGAEIALPLDIAEQEILKTTRAYISGDITF